MLIVIGVTVGILLGLMIPYNVPAALSSYFAIAILAGLDSVFGGIVASINSKFNLKVFVTGFFGNALLAAGVTYLGRLLGVDLMMAAIVVFGTRLFQNFAVIRRFFVDKWTKTKEFSK